MINDFDLIQRCDVSGFVKRHGHRHREKDQGVVDDLRVLHDAVDRVAGVLILEIGHRKAEDFVKEDAPHAAGRLGADQFPHKDRQA